MWYVVRLLCIYILINCFIHRCKTDAMKDFNSRCLMMDHPVLERMLIVSNCRISSLTLCATGSKHLSLGRLAKNIVPARRGVASSIRFVYTGLLLLALCGDIELNPGPQTQTSQAPHGLRCTMCNKAGRRNQLFMECNTCGKQTHRTCAKVPYVKYRKHIGTKSVQWTCWGCSMPTLSDSLFNNNFKIGLEEDGQTNTQNKKRNITFLSFNARSMVNKKRYADIQAWIEAKDPSVICCCETWLDSSIGDKEALPDGYTVFRKDRGGTGKGKQRGGGVLIATKSELQPTHVIDLDTESEVVWVEFSSGSKKYLVGSAYRPPNASSVTNSELIKSINKVQDIQHKYDTIILCGDFNIKIDWSLNDCSIPLDPLANDFLTSFYSALPHQMVKEATRVTSTSRSILDLVLTNNPDNFLDLEVVTGVSDHKAVLFGLHCLMPKVKIIQKITYNYGRADWTELEKQLEENLPLFCEEDDEGINNAWGRWKSVFWQCVDASIPKCNFKGKRRAPWINKLIIKKIHKRDYLYRHWKSHQTDENWERYRIQRNCTKSVVREAHAHYIWKLRGGNGKQLWKYIHGKIGSSAPHHYLINGVKETDSKKIAQEFANNFSTNFSAGTSDNSDLCPPQLRPSQKSSTLSTMCFSTQQVFNALKRIRPDGATGPDGVPSRILHKCATFIAPSLCSLYNMSMRNGEIPNEWKKANVVPVHKGGDRNDVKNYRPISLTSVLGKVMEKLVNARLLHHLKEVRGINIEQHGFLPRRSCVTMLTGAIDDWQHAMDSEAGSRVEVITLDWAKAFDRVPHKRLLMKLREFNISGKVFDWIESFLLGRSMKVVFDGADSSDFRVTSGVPQGSVLGPLLFTIFMMDLPRCVESKVRLYADDCTIYRTIKSATDVDILQKDLENIELWCELNQMKLNENKCSHITLTKSKKAQAIVFKINGCYIKREIKIKLLGITITQDLKWNIQTEIVRKKSAKLLGFLSRTLHGARSQVKRTVYLCLVRPTLSYGCPAWHPTSKANAYKLESLQNRATKFITKRKDLNRQQRTKICDILTLENHLKELGIVFLKKMFNGLVDLDPLTRIQLGYRSCRYGRAVTLIPPFARTTQYQQGFFCRSVSDWNALSYEVRTEQDFYKFRRDLRIALMNSQDHTS